MAATVSPAAGNLPVVSFDQNSVSRMRTRKDLPCKPLTVTTVISDLEGAPSGFLEVPLHHRRRPHSLDFVSDFVEYSAVSSHGAAQPSEVSLTSQKRLTSTQCGFSALRRQINEREGANRELLQTKIFGTFQLRKNEPQRPPNLRFVIYV